MDDFETWDESSVDLPDITAATCGRVVDRAADRAILVCGTGAGATMAAHRIPGIRCALANETYSARQAVEHDDANAIAVGAWLVGKAFVPLITDEFLAAQFDDDDATRRRVEKLDAMNPPRE